MQEITDFSGSLDLDSHETAIQPGDYTYALNFRNKYGVRSNLIGNRLINYALPAGRNKCVFTLPDDENKRLLYLVWNENNNHSILAYYPHNDEIKLIWQHSLLGLTEDKYIPGAGILPIFKDGQKQQLLFYSNGVVAPRCINLNEIGSLLPSPELYEEAFVSLIKPAPVMPLKVSLLSESAANKRSLLGNNVRTFIYRYVYKDYQRSKWSPESMPISAAYAELSRDPGKIYNAIKYDWSDDFIDFSTGGPSKKYRKLIDYIEVAVKDGINQPYRLVKRIRLTDNEEKSFEIFKNQNTYPVISSTGDLFDYVPRLSECCTVIDNRVVLVGNTDGFEHIDFNVTNPVNITPNAYQRATDGSRMSFKNNSRNQIVVTFYDAANRSTGAYAPEELQINVPAEFNRELAFIQGKRFGLTGTLPDEIVAFQFGVAANQDVSFFIQGIVNDISYIKDSTDKSSKVSIKRQIGTVGLKTSDGNWVETLEGSGNYRRVGSVGSDSKFYPLGTPIFEGGVDVDGKRLVVIRRESKLFGTNDDDMREEAIGKTASGKPIYYEGYNSPPSNTNRVLINEFISSVSLGDTRYLGIDISNWYSSSQKSGSETNPNNQQYYNFQQGDRVDILSNKDNGYVGLLSLPIIDYKDGVLIVPVTKELLAQTNYVLGPGTFIEVFTPKKPGETTPFYEIGPRYKVIDHTFPNQEFEVLNGGVHLVRKQMFANGYQTSEDNFVFSMNPDNERTFDTWETGLGRPNFVPEVRERIIKRPNQARASERLVEDSLINGTSSFPGLLEYTYPAEYGYITNAYPIQNNQVEQSGNVLMLEFSGERVSVYINKATFQDLAGKTVVGESDKVFGSYNTLLGSFGSVHPGASKKIDSRNYSWDGFKGCVVRYSRDGLTAISQFKAEKYFYNLSRYLGEYSAVGGYDAYNGEYLLTFIPKIGDTITIAWNENENRWKTFYSFAPEAYGSVGPTLLSFKDGQLYRHEDGPKANTFYGTKYDTLVEAVFNEQYVNKKVRQNVTLISTDKWEGVSVIGDYVTRPGRKRQETLWLLSHLKEEEDKFVTSLGKNINTPGKEAQQGYVNGEEMRSGILKVLLKLDPSVDYLSFLYTLTLDSATSNPENIKTNG